MESEVRTVWRAFHDQFDDALRGVIRYDGIEYETRSRRDVGELYTTRETQRLINEVAVGQLVTADLARTFKAGEYGASILAFDDAWVLVRPDTPGTSSGYVVSIERGGTDGSFDVDACMERFEEAVSKASDVIEGGAETTRRGQ